MDKEQKLLKLNEYAYQLFRDDVTGHDYFHMKRVAQMAKFISKEEQGDQFISEAAGWVHDVGDKKLFDDPDEATNKMLAFLNDIGLTAEMIHQIILAVADVSFSKGNLTPSTLEGKIVQDADRLDALGAIGIARTFAYGGAHNQLIYHPENQDGTSIQHFYDKLLLLKESMNTDTGKRLAEKRHLLMIHFLDEFHDEWD